MEEGWEIKSGETQNKQSEEQEEYIYILCIHIYFIHELTNKQLNSISKQSSLKHLFLFVHLLLLVVSYCLLLIK